MWCALSGAAVDNPDAAVAAAAATAAAELAVGEPDASSSLLLLPLDLRPVSTAGMQGQQQQHPGSQQQQQQQYSGSQQQQQTQQQQHPANHHQQQQQQPQQLPQWESLNSLQHPGFGQHRSRRLFDCTPWAGNSKPPAADTFPDGGVDQVDETSAGLLPVCKLVTKTGVGGFSYCSGTLIKANVLVTSRACTQNS